jgi:exopolyphosphatase/guanosine-5'-triphosphate,3'-diphosphate pyrophosphatase
MLRDMMSPIKAFLDLHTKNLHIDQAIGTGGNFECLGKLRVALLQKNSIFSMTRNELLELVSHLESMTIKERIQFLRLRPDRADVVVPAALAALTVLEVANVDVLMIPYVGLRDGILSDLSTNRSITPY